MAEWLKAPHSKCGILARVSRVRIPPSPPVANFIDPKTAMVAQRVAAAIAIGSAKTFEEVAADWVADNEAGWRNAKHRQQWENTLKTYASPIIGKLPVGTIDTAAVLRVLQPIWASKNETADRVRGRIEKIMKRAIVLKYHPGPNPATWKGNLECLLPARRKVHKVEHHPALITRRTLNSCVICASNSALPPSRWSSPF